MTDGDGLERPSLESLRQELLLASTYPASVCRGMALLSAPELSYLEASLLLAAEMDACLRATGLWALARCLDVEHPIVTLADNQEMNEQTLNLAALRCGCADSTLTAYIYNNLANTLANADDTVVMPDGVPMRKQDLYLQALRHSVSDTRKLAFVFCNLGSDLDDGAEVTLPPGDYPRFFPDKVRVCNRELYLEALHCDPQYALAWGCLGLCARGSVLCPDGKLRTRRQLMLEAVACDPDEAFGYVCLASDLKSREVVLLGDGRSLARHQLLVEALRSEPSNTYAASNLLAWMPLTEAWTRHSHTPLYGATDRRVTNVLFATLLLGLQRLETAGVLPLAHHSMLEDMLEAWTWGDHLKLELTQH